MRIHIALATSSALALALSACGGPPEADETVDAAATEEAVDVELPETMPTGDDDTVDGAEVDDEEAGEPEPVASASPTPTPTASRTRAPAPAPTQAMAVAKPQSFTTCGVCHSVEPGQNMIGPSLAGVVGRRAGSLAGANYSPAMQSANITWNEANLRRYIVDPNAVVPGGTMPAPGVSAAEAQAIVNYLKTL